MSNPNITQMIRRLGREDDNQAATELWEHNHPRLLKIAGNGLRRLRDDAVQDEDIVQNSMNSFFRALKAGSARGIKNRQELWGLLLTITKRKLNREYERANAAKRRSHDQVSIQHAHLDIAQTDTTALFSYCDELIESLKDPVLQLVAIRRLEGYTVVEIAEQLDVARATVKRRLSRIRELWLSEAEDKSVLPLH